jgi:hypothetical protein
MASSNCIRCNNSTFEIKENSPRGSRVKFFLLQCTSCGGVVGMTDYYPVGSETHGLSKRLEKIERSLASLGTELERLRRKLG